jgi:predicted metal-dependent enzyme (double-stranded beta helix superfamily)
MRCGARSDRRGVIGATIALNDLLTSCRAHLDDADPGAAGSVAVRATLATHRRAIALKYAEHDDIAVIDRSPRLTMLVVPTPPGRWYWPHEHRMWSVTAMLIGREHHVVYDRHDHGIVERRRFHIDEGIAAALPPDIVHAAGNEGDLVSIGLHIYGGDPSEAECLEWDPSTGKSRLVEGVH